MQLLINHILIKPDEGYDLVEMGSLGKMFALDTSYNPGFHNVSSGVVVAVPDQLYFNLQDSHEVSLRYNTELEVQPGDKVVVHYMAIAQAIQRGRIIDGCALVKYDGLMVRIRGEEIHPLNGIILAEPLEQTTLTHNVILPDKAKGNQSKSKSVVRYAGTPLKGYYDYPDEGADGITAIKTGDIIIHKVYDAIKIQYDLHQVFDKNKTLYRMHQRDIDSVINTDYEQVESAGDLLTAAPVQTEPPVIKFIAAKNHVIGTYKFNPVSGQVEFSAN